MARMLTTANTWRTGRSVLEAPVGQPIVHSQDLRLTGRLLASEGEEADLVLVEIHFAAHEAVGPQLAEGPGLPQQRHLAEAVASPQVDQPATGSLLQVPLPARGERLAVRGGLDPRRAMLAQRHHVPAGTLLQVLQVGVLEAGPDAGLP